MTLLTSFHVTIDTVVYPAIIGVVAVLLTFVVKLIRGSAWSILQAWLPMLVVGLGLIGFSVGDMPNPPDRPSGHELFMTPDSHRGKVLDIHQEQVKEAESGRILPRWADWTALAGGIGLAIAGLACLNLRHQEKKQVDQPVLMVTGLPASLRPTDDIAGQEVAEDGDDDPLAERIADLIAEHGKVDHRLNSLEANINRLRKLIPDQITSASGHPITPMPIYPIPTSSNVQIPGLVFKEDLNKLEGRIAGIESILQEKIGDLYQKMAESLQRWQVEFNQLKQQIVTSSDFDLLRDRIAATERALVNAATTGDEQLDKLDYRVGDLELQVQNLLGKGEPAENASEESLSAKDNLLLWGMPRADGRRWIPIDEAKSNTFMADEAKWYRFIVKGFPSPIVLCTRRGLAYYREGWTGLNSELVTHVLSNSGCQNPNEVPV